MKFTYGLKRICDVCFYMTFANFAGLVLGGDGLLSALPWFAAACFGSAILVERGAFKYLPMLFPAGCFFVVPINVPNLVVLIPICVYLTYTTPKTILRVEQDSYIRIHMRFIKIFFICFFPLIVFGMSAYLERGMLPYGIMFFALSSFLLRLIRHDETVLNDWHYKLRTIFSLSAIFAIGFIISMEITFIIGVIYFGIIVPILSLIIRALTWLLRGVEPRIPYFFPDFGDQSPMQAWMQDDWLQVAERQHSIFWAILGYIIIAVIISLIVYLLVQLFKKTVYKKSEESSNKTIESRTSITPMKKAARKQRSHKNNQIREIYRKFLKHCRKAGIGVTPTTTSLDIETLANKKFGMPQSRELRELYIKARYDDGAVVSKGEVSRAKEILRELGQGDSLSLR